MSYIRFTLLRKDSDSNRKLGALVAAHQLRDEGDLTAVQHEELRSVLKWFNTHLKIPKLLEKDHNAKALSWFKPEAKRPLEKMWQLKQILDLHNMTVEVHKTKDPG